MVIIEIFSFIGDLFVQFYWFQGFVNQKLSSFRLEDEISLNKWENFPKISSNLRNRSFSSAKSTIRSHQSPSFLISKYFPSQSITQINEIVKELLLWTPAFNTNQISYSLSCFVKSFFIISPHSRLAKRIV